jgi:hypothetical protein
MSFLSFFTRPRVSNPTQGNTQFVAGEIFDPGAEVFATESTVGDPVYVTRVFPQWNFTPLDVYQGTMVFQALSLPADLPAGFPFGGMRSTNLIAPTDYPDVTGDYWS